MACLTYNVQLATHPIDFTTIRNFCMFVILMPILYAPFGVIGYLFAGAEGEIG